MQPLDLKLKTQELDRDSRPGAAHGGYGPTVTVPLGFKLSGFLVAGTSQ